MPKPTSPPPASAASTATSSSAASSAPRETVKDTIISVVIAFTLAFVFRGFVVEAFIIPTGSMAPTLMGAHMRFTSGQTGSEWAVSPWFYADGFERQIPESVQSDASRVFVQPPPARNVEQVAMPGGRMGYRDIPVTTHDRSSGEVAAQRNVPLRSGDRILVLKYLYALHEPERFDVVVFKNPTQPSVNFIKRLVALPGEQVALVDGDVFVRQPDARTSAGGANLWDQPGWKIARKPDRVQRAVWQRVFDSSMAPLDRSRGGERGVGFVMPWAGAAFGESTTQRGAFVLKPGTPRGELAWDDSKVWSDSMAPGVGRATWVINDRYSYNDLPPGIGSRLYPVGDVRLGAGVEGFAGAGAVLSAKVEARGHEFVGELERAPSATDPAACVARVKMRPLRGTITSERPDAREGDDESPWTVLNERTVSVPLPPAVVGVEFWHNDQHLELRVDGRVVASGAYDWSPAQRVLNATGRTLASLTDSMPPYGNPLADPTLYRRAGASWSVRGVGATGGSAGGGAGQASSTGLVLHRLTLDRDIHYQPAFYFSEGMPAAPAVATAPATTITLEADQFFVLGDNSPQSQDGRLWDNPDPWVEYLMAKRGMDVRRGVVPRDLMLGRAFFVYFPSITYGGAPVPFIDFGKMRTIE